MEGDDDEDDIWDEKSLKQLKRKLENSTHKRGKSSTSSHKHAKFSKRLTKNVNDAEGSGASQMTNLCTSKDRKGSGNLRKAKQKRKREDSSSNGNEFQNASSGNIHQRSQCSSSTVSNDKVTPQKDIVDGCCPKCQMPFCALTGQSPGWHVRECLETKYSYIGDCADGIHCKSTFSPHYKRYSHKLLATTRSSGIFEKKDEGQSNKEDLLVKAKIQSSRQLNFSGQNLSEPAGGIKNKDCGSIPISSTLDEDNEDIKLLEHCGDELDLSASSANKEEIHCTGSMRNDCCSNTENTLYGGNVQTDHTGSDRKKKDKKTSRFSEGLETTDVDNSLARDGLMFDNRKTSTEIHIKHDSLIHHSNLEETSKSCSLSALHSVDEVSNAETEEFDMSSDDDLFGDPMAFESLCRSSDVLYHAAQDQGNDDSRQSFDLDETQCQHFSQTLDSVKQGNDSDTDEINFPLPSVDKKSQLRDKKKTLTVQSSTTQSQQSLLSFVTKSKSKSVLTKPALKQTDIGVFFGLKPLTKSVDSKLTGTVIQKDTKVPSSSQLPSVSHRRGGWRGRKHNQSDAKNIGYSSEGQSSGPGEDASAAPQSRRSCPFYKKIPGSAITVDAFRYGNIPGCLAYFLSHFHYDHYGGLNSKFTNPIYCSKYMAPGPAMSVVQPLAFMM